MATAFNSTLESAAQAAAEDAGADALADGHDAGTGAGYVEIRSGSAPAVGSAATGTLLVSIDLQDPSHGDSSSGTASINGTPSGEAVAAEADIDTNGAWFRAFDGDDTTVGQGDVANTDGGEEMIVDSNSISVGQTVTITQYDISPTIS